MISSKNFYFLISLLFGTFITVYSINCYVCDSNDVINDPYQCNEFFDNSNLKPQSCDNIKGAKYCIKQIGRFEGGLGTRRFCFSADMGNYCNYVTQPGDITVHRSCYFTCSTDGCNSANGLQYFYRVPLLLFISFVIFYLY